MTTFKAINFTTSEIVPAADLQSFQDSLDAIAPVGSYLLVHMTPPASGTLVNGAWLGCDGASVSASTYVKLYNTIGTVYGNPGGGNFNLPDFRGRSPFVAASGGSSDASLGKNDGAALASRRLKHSHSVTSTHAHSQSAPSVDVADSHSHTGIPLASGAGVLKGARSTFSYSNTGNSTSDVSATHSHSISGTMNNASTAVTAVGVSGLTDGPSFLVCCTVLIRAL